MNLRAVRDFAVRHAPALGVILLAAALPFLVPLFRGETPFFLDLEDHWYPHRLSAWAARQEGTDAHWSRSMFCGFPILAQSEMALSYPLHWVLDRIHPSLTLLPQVIGHRFILGLLLYVVVVHRGMSRTAGALAGCLVIFSGITTTCFSQLAVLRTLAWLPLTLIAVHLLGRGRLLAGAAVTATAVWLGLVAGYPPYLQRAGLLLVPLVLADPALPRDAAGFRALGARLAAGAAGVVLGIAMGAGQLFPTLALTAESQRQLGLDIDLLDALRARGSDLLLVFVPRLHIDNGIVKQGFAYVGAATLVLATLAVLRRRPGAAAFATGAGLCLVAAAGAATPLGALLYELPLASSFRNPTQYLVGWVLALPVLAAMGLDTWRERRPDRREIAIAAGVPFALLVAAILVPGVSTLGPNLLRAGIAVGAVAGAAALSLVASPRVAALGLCFLACGDAASLGFRYATKDGRTRPVAALREPAAPFARVAAHHAKTGDPWPARIITSNQRFNWDAHGQVAGLENARGLVTLLPLRTLDLVRIAEEGAPFPREAPRIPLYDYGPIKSIATPKIDLFAVRYAIGWADAPGPGWRRIGETEWERDAVAEARFPATIVEVGSDAAAAAALVDAAFDPRTSAVVDLGSAWKPAGAAPGAAAHAPGPQTSGTVRLVSIRANEVEIDVETQGAATLVWSQTWDAGWSCVADPSGDAEALDVYRANYAHMAVRLPSAGKRRLRWTYVAPGALAGEWLSFVACGAFALLVLSAKLRR